MTTSSNTDIQQLKDLIQDRFSQLDSKIDNLNNKVDTLTEKVNEIDKRLAVVESKVDSVEKRVNTFEGKLLDISEKFGELKNWRQIAFIIIAAIVGWLARSGKF
jgi:archaellum component FlaC